MSTLKEREKIVNSFFTEELLSVLLKDQSTGKNIIWATDDYNILGNEYHFESEILIKHITGDCSKIIKPRTKKKTEMKNQRSKDKAEVFTPAWVCNVQNNLIDNAWFGKNRRRFNTERIEGWETNYYPITFPDNIGKTWKDYVRDMRLEISCGEAPYLTSRYDAVSGKTIQVKNRIGLLDRKLRVIGENVETSQDWIRWAKEALKSIYGYEWQGDNLLLARKNIIASIIEAYYDKFQKILNYNTALIMAEIISWNIWQMDGIKFVVPNSCHTERIEEFSLFDKKVLEKKCLGCSSCNPLLHNGTYAKIKDWQNDKIVKFVNIVKGGN